MLGSDIDLGSPVSADPLNRGLVGWWLGLPGLAWGRTYFNIVRRGYLDLSFQSGPTWTAGPPGEGFPAVSFTGAGACIDAGFNAVPGTGPYAVDCWLQYTTTGLQVASGTDTGGSGNWWLGVGGGAPQFSVDGTTLNSGVSANDGKWHHVYAARTSTSGALEIWVDGVSRATGTSTSNITSTGFGVGRFGASTGFDWNGAISGFRYWIGAAPPGTLVWLDAVGGHQTTLRRWSQRSWLVNSSGNTPVSVALTGISSTSAAGTLTPSAAVTLTGGGSTGAVGTITASLVTPLTGGSSTSAPGTLTPALSPVLTGSYATAYGPTSIPCPQGQARQYDVGPFTGGTGDYVTLTGTVRVSRDTAYDEDGADTGFWRVGYSGTVGPWTVVLQYATPVDSSTRFLAVFCSSAAPADMSYGQDTGVTSCCGTYTTFSEGGSGTGTPPDPPDVAPVGLCDGCGDLFPSAAVVQTGLSSTASPGTTAAALTYTLVGQVVTTGHGSVVGSVSCPLYGVGSSPAVVTTYSTPGLYTWTAPAAGRVRFHAIGGGGAGTNSSTAGGGGGYGRSAVVSVTAGQSFDDIRVGAGTSDPSSVGDDSYVESANVYGYGGLSAENSGGPGAGGGYDGEAGWSGGDGSLVGTGEAGGGSAGRATGPGNNGTDEIGGAGGTADYADPVLGVTTTIAYGAGGYGVQAGSAPGGGGGGSNAGGVNNGGAGLIVAVFVPDVAAVAGVLTPGVAATLTGGAGTAGYGTLVAALNAALTGLSSTPGQGTVDPQTGYSATLTGLGVAVSQGTLGVSITTALTGQSAAVSQGTLTASSFVPFGEVYGRWQYPRPKTGRWQYTSPKVGTWAYPDERVGRWTPVA